MINYEVIENKKHIHDHIRKIIELWDKYEGNADDIDPIDAKMHARCMRVINENKVFIGADTMAQNIAELKRFFG